MLCIKSYVTCVHLRKIKGEAANVVNFRAAVWRTNRFMTQKPADTFCIWFPLPTDVKKYKSAVILRLLDVESIRHSGLLLSHQRSFRVSDESQVSQSHITKHCRSYGLCSK